MWRTGCRPPYACGCEPPVFVDVPDHRTEVLGLELACADYLSDVPWILVERGGDICHELEEVGQEYSADAIVVGSTHGIVGRIFGSVVETGSRAARSVRSSSSRNGGQSVTPDHFLIRRHISDDAASTSLRPA